MSNATWTVTDEIGTAGSMTVTEDTTYEQVYAWLVAAYGEDDADTVEVMEDAADYLTTNGQRTYERRATITGFLGLSIELTDDEDDD